MSANKKKLLDLELLKNILKNKELKLWEIFEKVILWFIKKRMYRIKSSSFNQIQRFIFAYSIGFYII